MMMFMWLDRSFFFLSSRKCLKQHLTFLYPSLQCDLVLVIWDRVWCTTSFAFFFMSVMLLLLECCTHEVVIVELPLRCCVAMLTLSVCFSVQMSISLSSWNTVFWGVCNYLKLFNIEVNDVIFDSPLNQTANIWKFVVNFLNIFKFQCTQMREIVSRCKWEILHQS